MSKFAGHQKAQIMSKRRNASIVARTAIYLVVIILIVGCFAMLPHIFSSHELIFQIIAVVLSVLFTAVVTNTLLTAQSDSEESKEKNVKIHENKVNTYSSFMKLLWGILDDGKITSEEIKSVRSELFGHVFFYLSDSELADIGTSIESFKSKLVNASSEEIDSSKGTMIYRDFATAIASFLKTDIMVSDFERKKKQESQTPNIEQMWLSLEFIAGKYPSGDEMIIDKTIQDKPKVNDSQSISDEDERPISDGALDLQPRQLKSQPWHFCEYDERQLEYLQEGGCELSLVEYGEYWRTNQVKQVQKGDVIFLFKGNKKYAGVFVAKGWRVFEYDEQRYVREVTSEGIDKVVVKGGKVPIDSVKEQLAKYDIYECFLDSSSTSCANIVVETVSFVPNGVNNPNTTYRKTISRYYSEYAIGLLDEFNKEESNPTVKERIASLFK